MPFSFLVFSDAHFHDYPFMATDTCEWDGMKGLNSRLMDCVKQFEYMLEYANTNNIKNIMFCGDLFHSKKMISKDVMNVIISLFYKAQGYGINFVMIPGNHDYVDKEGTNHSLLALTQFENIDIIDNDLVDKFSDVLVQYASNDVQARCLPYVESKEQLIKEMKKPFTRLSWQGNLPKYRILLSHAGMQGAKVGSDYVMVKDFDLSVSDVPNAEYDICLFGHFHQHQKVFDNGWIVGATHQMNWSDAGGTRGFLHVTLDKTNGNTVKHIPTAESLPRFHVLNYDSDFSEVRVHDFVKFNINEKLTEESLNNLKGFLVSKLGGLPAYLDPIPPKVTEEKQELSEKAISADTVIDEWVETKNSNLDKDILAKLGHSILLEARKKLEG